MKFFRYKQVCRIHFSGIDDELNAVASIYYNTNSNYSIITKLTPNYYDLELII